MIFQRFALDFVGQIRPNLGKLVQKQRKRGRFALPAQRAAVSNFYNINEEFCGASGGENPHHFPLSFNYDT
ncbi:MAG: hypothetical protein WBM11_12180, partial [Terriglobales bacterium]